MTNKAWAALQATEPVEVQRRTGIIAEFGELEGLTAVGPPVVDGARRHAWTDGCGQSAVWYYDRNSQILLLTFDHESDLNLFTQNTYALQERLYRGVPAELMRLVHNRPGNYESHNVAHPETGDRLHGAGGIFWYDGDRWHVADGLAEHCRHKGLDLFVVSGFDYCTEPYRFGLEFTAEAIVEERAATGWYSGVGRQWAELANLRKIFDHHPVT
jgi:hypothetical protein